VIGARGPFTLDGERALFDRYRFDVVVSKNSGGAATEAKLEIARERGLPVIMLERPPLPDADRMFETIEALLAALETWRVGNDVLAIRPSSGS
jgi:precorrin-6A/cobalt-precorrin-6A reductase